MTTPTRRTLLTALLLSPALIQARAPQNLPLAWATLERRSGGRLGACLLDTGSGLSWSHRGAERFGMCSTFKLPLAGAVLHAIDQGRLAPDARLPLREAERVPHMPTTEPLMARGWATPLDLAQGAQVSSDNLAANVLLRALGGPEGFTQWLRDQGDATTRVDRYEPEMNRLLPGDERDTSSPEAFAATVARLCTGTLLHADSRARLLAWMEATRTGGRRLRAGLPKAWRSGDKTGTGFHETQPDRINDTAIFWPPERGSKRASTLAPKPTPWVLSCFYEGPAKSTDWVRPQDEAVLAAVARLAAAWATAA
jgi:beta-lactamase class A